MRFDFNCDHKMTDEEKKKDRRFSKQMDSRRLTCNKRRNEKKKML